MAIIEPEGRNEAIIKMYLEVKNAHKVGRFFGLTRERIRQILEKNSIPTPRKSKKVASRVIHKSMAVMT